MLKKDLEIRVEQLEAEKAAMKDKVQALAEKVIEENCSDAIPYVQELSELMDFEVTEQGAIEFEVKLPLELMNKDSWEVEVEDFKLTYKGKEIKITDVESICS